MDRIVLSINKHPNQKLRLALSSLYVGASRVHDIDKLRVLPFWKEDADYLKSLKVDPLLKLWFQNYTEEGIWKTDGLQGFSSALRKKELMRLALVDDLSFWTGLEAKQFAKNLDVPIGSNKAAVLRVLKPLYDEGREYLTANGDLLLKRLRSDLIFKLRQKGTLGKLKISVLKSFAKRLGFDMSQRISRKNMESSLQTLIESCVVTTDTAHQTYTKSKEAMTGEVIDVKKSDIEKLAKKVNCLTVSSLNDPKAHVVHIKQYDTLDLTASKCLPQGGLSWANTVDKAMQMVNFLKQHSLYITGTLTLPDGCVYDRIYNVGGGDCFFISICQGLNFFGITMDHVELRTKVGRWLQNPSHALLMEMHLELQPSDLYNHLKEFPPPPTGWANYLNGMTWEDWGAHIEVLGGWVGPLEITPTNHVLADMGTDLRVNIYDPRNGQIFGDEENQLAGGIDRPIIMVMCFGGHYEWLRLRNE